MNSIFLEDRQLFLLRHVCWNGDFEHLFELFLPSQSFSEVDLFEPQEDLRELLERESSERRDLRLSIMPSGILFRDLVPYQSMPSFLRELSRRSFEEIRLVLIFFANMFRFCFFTRRIDNCPLCLLPLNAAHHFDCQVLQGLSPIDLTSWRNLAVRNEWRDFLDLFFVVSLIWTRHVNSVRCGHTRTIENANRMYIA
jgi:hypothetical protein